MSEVCVIDRTRAPGSGFRLHTARPSPPMLPLERDPGPTPAHTPCPACPYGDRKFTLHGKTTWRPSICEEDGCCWNERQGRPTGAPVILKPADEEPT